MSSWLFLWFAFPIANLVHSARFLDHFQLELPEILWFCTTWNNKIKIYKELKKKKIILAKLTLKMISNVDEFKCFIFLIKYFDDSFLKLVANMFVRTPNDMIRISNCSFSLNMCDMDDMHLNIRSTKFSSVANFSDVCSIWKKINTR